MKLNPLSCGLANPSIMTNFPSQWCNMEYIMGKLVKLLESHLA